MEKGLCGHYSNAGYCTFCDNFECKFNIKKNIENLMEKYRAMMIIAGMIIAFEKSFEKERNEINESTNNTEHKSGD